MSKKKFKLQSDEINEIAKAICALQEEMQAACKDTTNPFYKSKYADLSAIWGVCKQPLAKNELAVVQTSDTIDGVPCLITTLLHSSGQWIRGRYPLNPVKNEPQAHGSAVTYARRYMLSALLGVVTEDDDGNAGSEMGMGAIIKYEKKPSEKKEIDPELKKLNAAEKWTQEYIVDLHKCKNAAEFYKLKGDIKKREGRERIREAYPYLSEKITDAAKEVTMALKVPKVEEFITGTGIVAPTGVDHV